MHIHHLTFADGKTCTALVMEPSDIPGEDERGITNIFHPGYLARMERVVPEPPSKLPWKRQGDRWVLGRFVLRRQEEVFLLEWPGGSIVGGKEEVSSAVRENWKDGC